MKTLVNTFYNLELRLIENEITVLSLEAPSAYQKSCMICGNSTTEMKVLLFYLKMEKSSKYRKMLSVSIIHLLSI